MAKTKRKQLAAIAALKVTSPESSRMPIEEHQDAHHGALNENANDKSLAPPEVRQQRIIFWIPPLEPAPPPVNSKSVRYDSKSSRKRKRKLSSVNDEDGKSSSDDEDRHNYRKYAKIIHKLDSYNLIDPVWNRVSNVAVVPSVEEPNELHNGSDVVTSSNNAALTSRSRRISFLGRHAGTTEEELKRVNLSTIGNGENSARVKSVRISGRANTNGNNHLRENSGRAATSLHHENVDNQHIGNKHAREKSGGAATSLHHQNGDHGRIASNQLRAKSRGPATSLHRQNGDNSHIGNNRLRAKSGGTANSLHLQNGDSGHIEKSQSRAKSGGAATSSHNQNMDNGHIGNDLARAKSGEAVTSSHQPNGDNGRIGNISQLRAKSGRGATSLHRRNDDNGPTGNSQLRAKFGEAATSLHHQNGDNGLIGNTQLRAKFGGVGTSLHRWNGDNGDTELIRQGVKQFLPQSRLHGSRVRDHNDMAAMVRSKLDEVGGLTEWLIGGGLGVFVDLFQERKISEGDLLHLTMGSLKEIGVQAVGPRRKLIWMIEHLL